MCRIIILAILVTSYASNAKASDNIKNESTYYDVKFPNVSATISTTVIDGGTINIDGFTLEELCEMLNITKSECSCEIHPFFCTPPHRNIGVTTFTCTTLIDMTLGTIKLTTATFAIVGNGAVLVVSWYNHREMKQFRKLVAYLALVDFIFAALLVMTSIPLLWTCQWIYGGLMCKLLSSSVTFGGIVPLGIIIIIAVERYYGIVKPFAKKHALTKLWPSMSINVLVCFLSVIPLLITLQIDEFGLCTSDWKEMRRGSEIYNWFLLVATFIVPFCVASVLYTKIVRFLYTQVATSSGVLNMSEKQRYQRLKANKRVMKILATILVAYFILVLPNRLGFIILDYMTDTLSVRAYHAIKFFTLIPYHFHVTINPLIYSVIDKKFRKDFVSVIKKIKKQKENKSQ